MTANRQPSTRIGAMLRHHRKANGLTLAQLAEASNVSKSYLCELENHKSMYISAEKLYSITRALGVDIEYILQGVMSPGADMITKNPSALNTVKDLTNDLQRKGMKSTRMQFSLDGVHFAVELHITHINNIEVGGPVQQVRQLQKQVEKLEGDLCCAIDGQQCLAAQLGLPKEKP